MSEEYHGTPRNFLSNRNGSGIFMTPDVKLDSSPEVSDGHDNVITKEQSRRLSQIPFLRPDSFIEESEEENEEEFEKPTLSYLDQGLSLYKIASPNPNPKPQQFESPQQPFKFTSRLESPVHPSFMKEHFSQENANESRETAASNQLYYSQANASNTSVNVSDSRHKRMNSSSSQYITGSLVAPRSRSPVKPKSVVRNSSPTRSPTRQQPFKFGSILMNNSSENLSLSSTGPIGHSHRNVDSLSVPKASYRKGHRYKHSSVSMNMFQEPPKREPINLPKSYAIPKSADVIRSMDKHQKLKLVWAFSHVALSLIAYMFGFKFGNICLSTLSHLILYDSFGNLLVVLVQILANFEVWSNSSLKYPFGLGRIEVLVGFGLAVSLMFVGIDLFSHLAEELVISLVLEHSDEDSHSHHVHENKGAQLHPFFYELLILFIIAITLVSSRVVSFSTHPSPEQENEEDKLNRKPRMKRISSITLEQEVIRSTPVRNLKKKHSMLNNSTSILTLLYAFYSMLYPLAHGTEYVEIINQSSTLILAYLVFHFASSLIVKLSNILLLKKPFDHLESQIKKNVESLELYKPSYRIEHLLVSKVNHKIFIIVMKVKMIGASDDDESKLRFYATKIIKSLMYQELNGEPKRNATGDISDSRVSLIELLDVDQQFDSLDKSGEQLEITIDVDRL